MSDQGPIGTGIGLAERWEGRYYCYCGAKMEVDAPPHVVAEAKRIFWREHDGPGHGMCDRATCDYNRLLAEQKELPGFWDCRLD